MTLTTTLDKIKRLEQYVTVQETSSPVLTLALDKLLEREISRLEGMKRELQSDLLGFERIYGMDSQSFYRQYEAGKLGDHVLVNLMVESKPVRLQVGPTDFTRIS